MSNDFNRKRKKKLKRNDDISEAIAHVARVQRQKDKPKHTSRFFFKLDEPEIELKPEVEPVNAQLVKLAADLKKSLPAELETLSDKVRTFFLSELAPIMLASFMAAEQSREVLSEALGLEVDASTETKFKAFMIKAADVRMIRYVQKIMQLSDDDAHLLLDTLKPRQPSSIVMPLGSPYESKVKHKKEKSQGGSGRRDSSSRQSEVDLP